ncbi:MAG: hypothetical protein ACI9B9_002513 [Halioglobus sp.]|jgi:hypothetical protein
MCPVWKREIYSGDEFRDRLLAVVVPALHALPRVKQLKIAVVDSDVDTASGRRLESFAPLADGVVTIFCEGELDESAVRAVLLATVKGCDVFGVDETVAIENIEHRGIVGERLFGFCQMVFLQRPARLTEAEWRDNWQRLHTPIAIEIQANFAYCQNRIISNSADNALPIDALVEESFIPEAMTSDHAFFGVENDDELQARQTKMMESCGRFLDYDKIDVIPMSEYIV